MNIYWMGLGGTYTTLVARLLSNPTVAITANPVAKFGIYQTVEDFGGDRGWNFTNTHFIPAGHPHFPYGFAVEPDLHT